MMSASFRWVRRIDGCNASQRCDDVLTGGRFVKDLKNVIILDAKGPGNSRFSTPASQLRNSKFPVHHAEAQIPFLTTLCLSHQK